MDDYDGEENDNKYDKARRQRQQGILFVIILFVPLLIALYVVLHHRSANADEVMTENKEIDLVPGTRNVESKRKNKKYTVSLATLRQNITHWDSKVREIRKRVDIFETNAEGHEAATELQGVTRLYLNQYYGPHEPYRVEVNLEFQDTMPDYQEKGPHGTFVIELAPSTLQPHSIYTFLELARTFHGGAFHRIAGHVLQVLMRTKIKHLAFQEYSPAYPHREGTVGYAGRPSGPEWYVSTKDNTRNHGPGSQQQHNPYEADSCFGKVIEGYDTIVQERISKAPSDGTGDPAGFLKKQQYWVKISSMVIMVPDEHGEYRKWIAPKEEIEEETA